MQYFRKGLSGKTQMAGELRNRGLQTGNHLFKQDFARMWGLCISTGTSAQW